MSGIFKIILAMINWGSLGVFVKNINIESFEIAFLRALIASFLLGVILVFKSRKENKEIHTLFNNDSNDKRGIYILIVSGVLIVKNQVDISFGAYNHTKGIILALGAAFLYASVIMLNKYTKSFGDYERTFIQLFAGAIVLLPFFSHSRFKSSKCSYFKLY